MIGSAKGVDYKYSPKEKLSIQVADIYGIHVDDMNVLETRKREIG